MTSKRLHVIITLYLTRKLSQNAKAKWEKKVYPMIQKLVEPPLVQKNLK